MQSVPPVHHTLQKNTTLKRDKQGFRMSTAAFSTAQSAPSNKQPEPRKKQLEERPPVIPQQQYQRKSERKSYSKVLKQQHNVQNLPQSQILHKLTKHVNDQRQSTRDQDKLASHQTHNYTAFYEQPTQLNRYNLSEQQCFPPRFVKQLYQRELQSRRDSAVNYQWGHLERCGYFYFCVERTLVLIDSLSYIDYRQSQQPIVFTAAEPVLSVLDIVVADLEVESIDRHPFGQRGLVLMLWSQWSVSFYSFEPRALVKFSDLNMRLQISCESAFLFDYCKRGNVYYMNEAGQLGKIELFSQNFITLWNWRKRYSLTEYFFKFKHNTKRKRQLNPTLSLWQRLSELKKDWSYFRSHKKTKAISLTCDRPRSLLYTLVETSWKQNQCYDPVTCHRQLRIYSLLPSPQDNFLHRIQDQLSGHPPILAKQLTEQQLYNQTGMHLFNHLQLPKFQICGVHIPSYLKTGYNNLSTNLILLLRNGSRMMFHHSLQQSKLILNQVVHLPNLEQLLVTYRKHFNVVKAQNFNITQKQPLSFTIHTHRYCPEDNSLAVIGSYKKSMLALLMTPMHGDNSRYQQQVAVLWQQLLNDGDRNIKSVFINQGDYRIFVSPELQRNLYKQRLSAYACAIKGGKTQTKQNCNNNTPEARQALHYPRQMLFLNRQKIHGITKLRLIDLLFGTLQREVTKPSEAQGDMTDYALMQLLKCIEGTLKMEIRGSRSNRVQLLRMLVQIYCDVDGVYYYDLAPRIRPGHEKLPIELPGDGSSVFENRQTKQTVRKNHSIGSFQTQNLRKSTKRYTATSNLIKCRQSDLLFMQSMPNIAPDRHETSMYRPHRSDQSIMRLVLKLMVYIVKEKTEDRGRGQSLWKTSVKSEQIGSAFMVYLARVMAPIWAIKMKRVQSTIYPYLSDITMRVLQMLGKLENQLIVCELSPSFKQSMGLFSFLIEYNNLLTVLSNPPMLTYSEGLSVDRNVFEEALFYSLQKETDISKAVIEWRGLLPNFFNLRLYRAVKVQAEIAAIGSEKEKKNVILREYREMPQYLLYNYFKEGLLSKFQIQILLKQSQDSANLSSLKSVNDLVITDSMNPQDKVQYALVEIVKTSRNLEQKQFLLNFAFQNLKNIRDLPDQSILKRTQQLDRIKKLIKIQRLMLNEIDQKQKTKNQTLVSEASRNLLKTHLLPPPQLKTLINQLHSPSIEIIYYCSFTDPQSQIQPSLRGLLFGQDSKPLPSVKIREKLEFIFANVPANTAQHLPLPLMLTLLDEVNYSQVRDTNMIELIKCNEESRIRAQFWVSQFLSQWGWRSHLILEHYLDNCRKSITKVRGILAVKTQCLYYWLQGYCLVKGRYPDGRRLYQVETEKMLRETAGGAVDMEFGVMTGFIERNLTG